MEVSDPRTVGFARIPPAQCLLVYNSDLPWSRVAADAYALARGVPTGNVLGVPMGTTEPWDPGTTDTLRAVASLVREYWLAKQCRGILMAPGVPTRALCRGALIAGDYNPAAVGYPAVGALLAGSPSLEAEIAGTVLTCQENGSGRWEWYRRDETIDGLVRQLWRGRFAWYLGLSDDRSSTEYETGGLAPIDPYPGFQPSTLTPDATRLVGDSPARILPIGKIGWGSWRSASNPVPESPSNWGGPLASGLAGDGLLAQPAPILTSLLEVSGDLLAQAALHTRLLEWGYDAEYYYRQSSIPGDVEALCPVAGAVWSKSDFEGGSIVDAPYYLLTGSAPNADEPQTDAPYDTALEPAAGSQVASMGASYAHEWALHSFRTGGAAGNTDQTHRSSTEMGSVWLRTWLMLGGRSGLELSAATSSVSTNLPAGDPLARLFPWDAAPDPGLLPWTPVPRRRAPSYWAPRRLRSGR